MSEMIKYDNKKLKHMLREKYFEEHNKYPSNQLDRLIDCIDDAFMDEWRRRIMDADNEIKQDLESTLDMAYKTMSSLQAEIEVCRESGIQDQRVIDALKAYKMIVDLKFETPQQRLQNIQNASYFIWALYFQGGGATNMFFKDIVTDVKQEDDSDNHFRDIKFN